MRTLPTLAHLTIAAAILLLVGCAENGAPMSQHTAEQQRSTGPSFPSMQVLPVTSNSTLLFSANGPRQLIYVDYFQNAPTTNIRVYDEKNPSHFVTKLGARTLTVPEHMAVDGGGTVYVANSQGPGNQGYGEIDAYAPGSNMPSKILKIPSPFFVYGVCVRSGILYAVTWGPTDSGPWPVYQFANGSKTPTSTIYSYPTSYEPRACAVDSKGNLDVLYYNQSSQASIDQFAPGSNTPQTLAISLQNGEDIAVDASDNLLVSGNAPGGPFAVFVFAPGQTVPSASFDSGGNPWGFSLGSSGKNLYVIDVCANPGCTQTHVLVYDYASGNLVGSFAADGKKHGSQFIAVTPRAP